MHGLARLLNPAAPEPAHRELGDELPDLAIELLIGLLGRVLELFDDLAVKADQIGALEDVEGEGAGSRCSNFPR